MAGVSRAEQLGRRCGIGVIAGAELSAWDFVRKRKVHLLCYLPKNPDRLEGLMKHTRENRDKAMRESMHRVMRLFPVTEEHILRYAQGSSTLHHVHIMSALMDLGYANTVYGDLFQELLSPHGSCYTPFSYPEVREAAALIKSAVSYTHLRAHETGRNLVCRLLLEKKNLKKKKTHKEIY